MSSKRKLEPIHVQPSSTSSLDNEEKRRRINVNGEEEDLGDQLYKYHRLLPDYLKPDIKSEIYEYKREIFQDLYAFHALLTSSKQALSASQWDKFEDILSLMRRYHELHYPFSKREKEELCTKLYSILTHEGPSVVDYYIQTACCISMNHLIKKKEKLDIVFDWRPLYKILDKTYFPKFRKAFYTPKDHGSSLVDLVRKIKRYFPPNAAEEIWEELRPIMCIHDHLLFKAQGFLCLFLPTTQDNITWLDELMALWSWVSMHPTWDQSIMTLISEIAEEQVGKIDFEPYMSFIFTRLLYALDVPVGNSPSYLYDDYPVSECTLFASFEYAKNLVVAHAAKFIIWSLYPGCTVIEYLKKLLRSTESYYHPSNEGSWTGPIGDFLLVLSSIFGNRLNKENKKKKIIPESYKLTDDIIKEFVQIIQPVAMKAMYSKSGQMTSCANHSLKFMAYLAPDIIFPPLMEACFHALQTLTETHQTVSALETLSLVIFPLLKQSHYPEGSKYLTDLMMLTLPGIDTNDMRKTYSTLKFYKSMLACIPLFGFQTARSSDMIIDEDDEANMPEAVRFFEDWCIQFLDRLFTVLSHQSPPKKDGANTGDTISSSIFWSVCDLFFNQLSPELHNRCLKKLFAFVSNEFLVNAQKNIGHMCAAVSNANSKTTLELFMPMLYDRLIDPDTKKLKHLTESETQWYIHMMGKVVLLAGPEILKYKDKIMKIIELTYQSDEKKIIKSCGKLLKNILKSLTAHHPLDIRSVNPEVWHSEDFKYVHFKYWSEFPTLDEMNVRWHIPNDEEIKFAIDLVNQFLKRPYTLINEHIKEILEGKDKMSSTKKQVKHALILIGYIIRGGDSLFPEIQDEIIEGYERYANSRKISAALSLADRVSDEKKLNYTFKDILLLCHSLIQTILQHRKDQDISLLNLMTKLIYNVICKRGGITQVRYKQKRESHEMIKLQSYKDVFSKKGQKYPRYMLVSRAFLEYRLRCVLYNESLSFTKTYQLILDDLAQLALSTYSIVRKKAQRVLFSSFTKFADKLVCQYLPRFMEVLRNPNSTDGEYTGAIYSLEKYAAVKSVIRSWDIFSQFLLTIVQTSHIEKQTIQERLVVLYDTYFGAFYHVTITGEDIEKYNNLLLSLVSLVESNKNMHWKYQTVIASFLMLMIRADNILVPLPVATYFFKQMASDIDKIRNIAVESIELILCQYKPVQRKKTVTYPRNYSLLEANKWCNIKYPKNSEEWDCCDFLEKNYSGWYTTPRICQIYDYSSREPVDDHMEQREALKEEYNKIMTDDFLKKLFENMVLREDTFNEANSQMFKGMFQIFGIQFLEKVKPHFEDLLRTAGTGKQEEPYYMSLSAELVSGLIRGMKHWTFDDHEKTYKYLCNILDKVLQETSMNCVGEWCECFEFAICDKDPRRVKWIKDYMLDKLEKLIGNEDNRKLTSSSNQVRYLRYLYGTIGEISWRDPDTLVSLMEIMKKNLAAPYEQVRECISAFLAMIYKTMWKPLRNSQNLAIFGKNEYASKAIVEFTQFTKEQFESKIQSTNDVELTDLKALSRTIMNWSSSLFSSYCPHSGVAFVTDFINMLAKIYGSSSSEDEDIQDLAADNLITISAFPFNAEESIKILTFLSDTLYHVKNSVLVYPNWRVRQTLLEFIQVFGFRQQFYLIREQDKLIDLILSLLKDPQLEVRECASTTLAGFIKITETKYIELLNDRFGKWVKGGSFVHSKKQSSRHKRKRASVTSLQTAGSSISESDAALLRHSGVLGLSAIVKACPYSIPDYLPPVLVQLARFANDPSQPIRDSTRKTFAEFWKQHGDLWHLQKKKFTESQLQVLNSLLISPSYYA